MNSALATGQAVETSRIFARTDGDDLIRLSGAPGSTHAVPEALINGMFSYLLGVDLPGQGTNYLKQETEFLGDAAYGEELTARVEITRLRPDKHLVDLETTCRSENGRLIARGRALVLARDVAGAWG
ncbi:phosphate acetyltransferase [Maricaulis sp. MIT060901]|uniref:phosphate acetyltransferase n=1 Tax=Maricaulis sp. MIT060901 TaxID=3096993 RepID=UPI00399A53F8